MDSLMTRSWWWCSLPGIEVRVKWPPNGNPDLFYRPELEEKVGDQVIDWDWIMDVDSTSAREMTKEKVIVIKFHERHYKWASYFALKWN